MDDAAFLASYDPSAFPPLAVAVDIVALTWSDGQLKLLLHRRPEAPARGRLALPGTFVGVDEALDTAAQRGLRNKAGLLAPVRQFHAFGAVDRDPRMRIVSIGYMAVADAATMEVSTGASCELVPIVDGAPRSASDRRINLPFDHADVLARALADLRRDLDRDDWAFGLLPPTFSLRELQALHEAIRGERLNKPAFRKRLIESGRIEPTGEMETGKGFRPAELYRVRGRS